MAAIPRPIVYGLVVVILAISYAWANQSDDQPVKKAAGPPAVAPPATNSEYNEFDYSARFDSPSRKKAMRNVFKPLVMADTAETVDVPLFTKDILRIPATLAGGDPNWIFTGYASINGQRQGLLENTVTHKGGFVVEGQAWKSSRVIHITSESIAFSDSMGNALVVMRFDPVLAAKGDKNNPGPAGAKPLDPTAGISGPIGSPQGAPTGPTGGPGRVRTVPGAAPGVQSFVIQPSGPVSIGD